MDSVRGTFPTPALTGTSCLFRGSCSRYLFSCVVPPPSTAVGMSPPPTKETKTPGTFQEYSCPPRRGGKQKQFLRETCPHDFEQRRDTHPINKAPWQTTYRSRFELTHFRSRASRIAAFRASTSAFLVAFACFVFVFAANQRNDKLTVESKITAAQNDHDCRAEKRTAPKLRVCREQTSRDTDHRKTRDTPTSTPEHT